MRLTDDEKDEDRHGQGRRLPFPCIMILSVGIMMDSIAVLQPKSVTQTGLRTQVMSTGAYTFWSHFNLPCFHLKS